MLRGFLPVLHEQTFNKGCRSCQKRGLFKSAIGRRVVTHTLEEKLKDLLDANTRIEDLHMEEERLEKLVKKYQGTNYIMSSGNYEYGN